MKWLRWTAVAAILGAAGWVTYQHLAEAYGSGSPYYGRTTNLDKWTNPWPGVLTIDAGALIATGLLVMRRRRKKVGSQ